MDYPNIFTPEVSEEIITRINSLTPETPALWGKLDVAQMLAHCCVTYEMVFTDKHPVPRGLMKIVLRLLVKKKVTGKGRYGRNNPTAPQFIMVDPKTFETEKNRLIDYIRQVQQLGEGAFQGRFYPSFGKLTANEYNNMFYKHLDHHLSQFGA